MAYQTLARPAYFQLLSRLIAASWVTMTPALTDANSYNSPQIVVILDRCRGQYQTILDAVSEYVKNIKKDAPHFSYLLTECSQDTGYIYSAIEKAILTEPGFVFIWAPEDYYGDAELFAYELRRRETLGIIFDGENVNRTIRAAKLSIALWLDMANWGQQWHSQEELTKRFWEGMTK
jgi:hypothetical protein